MLIPYIYENVSVAVIYARGLKWLREGVMAWRSSDRPPARPFSRDPCRVYLTTRALSLAWLGEACVRGAKYVGRLARAATAHSFSSLSLFIGGDGLQKTSTVLGC